VTAPHPAVSARSTQSLVAIQAELWRRPGLLARELAWRWLYGIPALLIMAHYAQQLLNLLLASNTGIEDFSLQQPAVAAQIIAASWHAIAPAALHIAAWLAPALMLGWAIASGIGRAIVLRAITSQPRLQIVPLTLLQLLRILALAAAWTLWFQAVRWAAHRTIISGAALPTAEPDFVGFAAALISLSLGAFVLWALTSWILSIATVLVVAPNSNADRRSTASALAAAFRQGPLTMQLVEVNLVLGIVKLALIVLAMVFSAIPLPFETVMTGHALDAWWAFVAILYLAASDFFQVARLAAFHTFSQSHATKTGAPS
jgi:hypothetical protein